MLDKDIRRIIIGKRVTSGIRPLKKGFSSANIIGFDIEAAGSVPYSLQMHDMNGSVFQWIKDWSQKEVLDFIFERAKRGFNCIFAHNLSYDIGNLFKDLCIYQPNMYKGYKAKVIYSENVAFVKLTDKNDHKTVQFMDTFQFFKSSLAKAAEQFKLDVKKLERPSCVKEGRFPKKNEMDYLKEYAVIDAQIVYELGYLIMIQHEEHDIPLAWTVTPATMAAKIIRKNHIKKIIPFPPRPIAIIGLRSYNGGRTECFGYGTKRCKVYDINSAYPHAFASIPIPMENKWKTVRGFKSEEGFYLISGSLPDMKVSPLPLRKKFLFFPVGNFKNVFVTGYEAKNILEYGKIDKIKGWIYIGKSDDGIRDFIFDEFRKKAEYKAIGNYIKYYWSKLSMNGAYGKTAQRTQVDYRFRRVKFSTFDVATNELKEVEVEQKFIAGGMFNPVIASWITGFVKARLFRMMYKFQNNMISTDTDSLIVKGNPNIPTGNKLGDLDFEKKGKGLFVREKVYMITNGKELIKSAQHGFWDKPEILHKKLSNKKFINQKRIDYSINRMIRLKEARKQNLIPFTWRDQIRSLSLAPSIKRERPKNWETIDITKDFVELKPINLCR